MRYYCVIKGGIILQRGLKGGFPPYYTTTGVKGGFPPLLYYNGGLRGETPYFF